VIQGEYVGMWGNLPKITQVDVKYECITKAWILAWNLSETF
jgi:hypothetical protein